jgi:hypothetical protein
MEIIFDWINGFSRILTNWERGRLARNDKKERPGRSRSHYVVFFFAFGLKNAYHFFHYEQSVISFAGA